MKMRGTVTGAPFLIASGTIFKIPTSNVTQIHVRNVVWKFVPRQYERSGPLDLFDYINKSIRWQMDPTPI